MYVHRKLQGKLERVGRKLIREEASSPPTPTDATAVKSVAEEERVNEVTVESRRKQLVGRILPLISEACKVSHNVGIAFIGMVVLLREEGTITRGELQEALRCYKNKERLVRASSMLMMGGVG